MVYRCEHEWTCDPSVNWRAWAPLRTNVTSSVRGTGPSDQGSRAIFSSWTKTRQSSPRRRAAHIAERTLLENELPCHELGHASDRNSQWGLGKTKGLATREKEENVAQNASVCLKSERFPYNRPVCLKFGEFSLASTRNYTRVGCSIYNRYQRIGLVLSEITAALFSVLDNRFGKDWSQPKNCRKISDSENPRSVPSLSFCKASEVSVSGLGPLYPLPAASVGFSQSGNLSWLSNSYCWLCISTIKYFMIHDCNQESWDVKKMRLHSELLSQIVMMHNKTKGKRRGYAFIECEHERDIYCNSRQDRGNGK